MKMNLLSKLQKKFGYKINEAYFDAIIPIHMQLDHDDTKPTDTFLSSTLNNREIEIHEAYDDVSMESIKDGKKLSDYTDYDNIQIINNNTYLHFIGKKEYPYLETYLWGKILVFDNTDNTEIARVTYMKQYENSFLVAVIDVRNDKRRQGIASNMYSWVENLTGEKLYPDIPHSPSAKALWNNPNRTFGFDK